MLLLDDPGDVAVTPQIPTAFEIGDECERDEHEHARAVNALRNGVPVQRGQQKSSAHKNAEREDHGEMAEESRATHGLADFRDAGFEDGACDHGGEINGGSSRFRASGATAKWPAQSPVRAWHTPGGLCG